MTHPHYNKPESLVHHEARKAHMREQFAEEQKVKEAEEAERHAEAAAKKQVAQEEQQKALSAQSGLVKQTDTREMLLDRIRQMREVKPVEHVPLGRTPAMQAEYDAEVACGRKRQQEFEAEMNANRERVKRMEAEQAAKEGSMVPVHHPNPTQGEVFPVNKATFK